MCHQANESIVYSLQFYWKPIAERITRTGCKNVVSFGCGDAQVEVGVATGLRKEGIDDFRFHCVELSPMQIQRAREFVAKAGLTENFIFEEQDFNTWEAGGQVFAGAMCHHALHHVLNLEHLIAAIRGALHPEGCFASIDVVGRNGHMRWPEALEIIERVGAFCPWRNAAITSRKPSVKIARTATLPVGQSRSSMSRTPCISSENSSNPEPSPPSSPAPASPRAEHAGHVVKAVADSPPSFADLSPRLDGRPDGLGHIRPTRMRAATVPQVRKPAKMRRHLKQKRPSALEVI